MISHWKITIATLLSAAGGMMSAGAFAADIPAAIKSALAYTGRPPFEMERDAALKPGEILAPIGLKPGMNTMVLMPEGGYWPRILSSIVGPKGHVYSVVSVGSSSIYKWRGPMIADVDQNMPLSRVDLAQTVQDQPEFTKNVSVYWESIAERVSVPAQVSLVVLADNYHVFKGPEFVKLNMTKANKAIFNAMKNGGTYLVIDNQAAKGKGFADAGPLGRVEADAVKAEVLAAGFEFAGESDVLAKADDDHAKAASSDNADMFVLRFKKPPNAENTDKRPKNQILAMAGYFNNTRMGTVGGTGDKGGARERRAFFHLDGTYEEFGAKGTGNDPFQAGTWYIDDEGGNCMLHEYPLEDRSATACNNDHARLFKKPGDTWTGQGANGRGYALDKGLQYFKDDGSGK